MTSKVTNWKKGFLKVVADKKLIGEIFRFLIVGGFATIIDMFVMGIVLYFMQTGIYPHFYNVFWGATGNPSTLSTVIGTGLGFFVGLIFNYICSVLFVFINKGKSKSGKGFIIFALLSAVGLLIHTVGMYLGYNLLDINEWIVKFVITIIVLIYNYISKKLLIFKKCKISKIENQSNEKPDISISSIDTEVRGYKDTK